MTYPSDALFDIETLVNVAQAEKILVLGDCDPVFLANYKEQKELLNQQCEIVHFASADIQKIWSEKPLQQGLEQDQRFDVAIVIDLFEHLDKAKGMQVLAQLRDVLSAQYCICLPLSRQASATKWQLTDLFSFALSRVASYTQNETNSDNWANPQMWGKYWW